MKKKQQPQPPQNQSTLSNPNPLPTPSTILTPSQHLSTFPIWEKVYLDLKDSPLKDNDSFFLTSTSLYLPQHKKCYFFPKYKPTQTSHYAVLDIEKTHIQFYIMPYECFNPVLDSSSNKIYLYTYDTSYGSDYRYSIIEFLPSKGSFSLLNHKGIAPKARREAFVSFILNKKMYFFGGVQMFPGDNSMNYMYSFNLKENEWNIESYEGIYHNDNVNLNYIMNTFDVVSINIESNTPIQCNNCIYGNGPSLNNSSEDNNNNNNKTTSIPHTNSKVLLIGGKYFDDVFYSNMSIATKIQNARESNEIVEFTSNPTPKFTRLYPSSSSQIQNDISFYNHAVYSIALDNQLLIFTKGNLFLYNITSNDINMIKPRLFSPETSNGSHCCLTVINSYLYLIGKFKCYEDCYVFKTSYENLLIKWNKDKLISYENLLNVKECSDMVCSFNNGDKTKEIYLNRKILFNFSLALKNLIINWSQNSNVYIFNDINYITMYNILKFIYSNFYENISNIEIEILNEMFFVLLRYRAKSLLNIIIDHIQITSDKAVKIYEISLKHSLHDLMKKCEKYISEHLNSRLVMNEGNELKCVLYENYFCEHKIYVQCNIAGIDIKNISQITITNEKVNEIKEISKNGKLMFCLNCLKVFKQENNERSGNSMNNGNIC